MNEIMDLPFMVALVEARYDDLVSLFPAFRRQLSHKCNNRNLAPYEAHIALIIVKEEITSALETVSGGVVRTLKRALIIVQGLISHVRLCIIYPQSLGNTSLPKEDTGYLKTLVTSGHLSKKQLIALGCSVYETAYINSGISQTEFIIGFGKYFNMTISESYARTAITDIRNDFKDGTPSYVSIFWERLSSKMEKLNNDSDEAYDKKIRDLRRSHNDV